MWCGSQVVPLAFCLATQPDAGLIGRISSLLRRQLFEKLPEFLKTGRIDEPFPTHCFTPQELTTLLETCGLRVVRLIGKPILTRLPREQQELITTHFQQILEIELQYCDHPHLTGLGNHLEIVGQKIERS